MPFKVPLNLTETQTATKTDLSLDRSISESGQRGFDTDVLNEVVSAIKWFQDTDSEPIRSLRWR